VTSFISIELPYSVNAKHYYAALADMPWAVWLDSGGMARYDIITAAPRRSIVIEASDAAIDPFKWIRSELGERADVIPEVPFAGGALGYWGYDLAHYLTPGDWATTKCSENAPPDMAVGIYDWALVLDHDRKIARIVSHRRFNETNQLLEEILRRLQGHIRLPVDDFRVSGKISSNFTLDSYANAFTVIQKYLLSGDCYQINLAQCFKARARGDAFGAYLKLREMSPAPYSAFLNLPQLQVLCASPECFLHVRNGSVESRPIKGTRPRSKDKKQDQLLAEELQGHPKDRAENLMIVDMLRNDLGKSCLPGTVSVPKLFEVESYSNVHHLVSTVKGQLAEKKDAVSILRDCFPGASVTGAPKLRAMQIIDHLEPDRRGIYCGTI